MSIASNISSNERRICEAIARMLEVRSGCKRHSNSFPEIDRTGPPIDYVFWLGEQQCALEHTLIEPFEDYIRMAVESDPFLCSLREMVEGYLPAPGIYYLDVPIDPTAGLHRSEHLRVQEEIARWAIERAKEMYLESRIKPDRDRLPSGREQRVETHFANIRVVLRRQLHWSLATRFDGCVFVGRYAPPRYEELRRPRIERALCKKSMQLEPYKHARARVSLVLEDRDLFLSNHMIVGDLAIDVIKSQGLVFDEVLYADTTIDTNWTVVSILRDGIAWPDDETEDRYTKFDPRTL